MGHTFNKCSLQWHRFASHLKRTSITSQIASSCALIVSRPQRKHPCSTRMQSACATTGNCSKKQVSNNPSYRICIEETNLGINYSIIRDMGFTEAIQGIKKLSLYKDFSIARLKEIAKAIWLFSYKYRATLHTKMINTYATPMLRRN